MNIINSFMKVAGHKINLKKLVAFLYTNNEQTEEEYRKISIYSSFKKKSGINLPKDVKDI
jgi:hypothetical protein